VKSLSAHTLTQCSLRSARSRIDVLTPTVALTAANTVASTSPAVNAGSAWWAIQVLVRTGVGRGKQGLATMGAGADLFRVKTTQHAGTDVTFITSSPGCLLCRIV
jgi:hypothetical protein